MKSNKITIQKEAIESKIYCIRGKRVMLDRDLAQLYGVTTGNLNLAVKRNGKRFPDNFMFQLTQQEVKDLILQNATSSWGGVRKLPYAFTEQGVAMLSGVLHSDRAVEVNSRIMRTFVKLRGLAVTHKELKEKIDMMEKKYDYQFKIVFDAIKQLITSPEKPRRRIGFYSME